jgi:uncharacterized protein YndB with AHSA1/START domain
MIEKDIQSQTAHKGVTLTRVFDAPRELVFKAWVDPKHVAQWWGPHGFTVPACELDARPGGAIRIDMRGPDGVVYPNRGVFREIVAPERLVAITRVSDESGELGLEDVTTVTFADLNGATKISLHAAIVQAAPEMADAVAGMEEGWSQSLDRLAEYLKSVPGR